MDSVSSDQAIITSHRHHPCIHILSLCTMHKLCITPSQSCLLPFYTIPKFPLHNSKDFSFTCPFSFKFPLHNSFTCLFSLFTCIACSWPSHAKNKHNARTRGKMSLLTSWRVVQLLQCYSIAIRLHARVYKNNTIIKLIRNAPCFCGRQRTLHCSSVVQYTLTRLSAYGWFGFSTRR